MVIIGNGGIATEMVNKLDNVQIVWAIKDTSVNSVFSYPGAGEFFIKELHKDKVETDKPVKRMKYILRGHNVNSLNKTKKKHPLSVKTSFGP